jgi:hypothetical protein
VFVCVCVCVGGGGERELSCGQGGRLNGSLVKVAGWMAWEKKKVKSGSA